MRIAFYAPMKPPEHAVPSGDRRMARLLIAALEQAGHCVFVASELRVWEGEGDFAVQAELRALAQAEASRLEAELSGPERPDLWFTYHLYHKAPDWIGPRVADALGIPYAVAEGSYAPKQAGGPWDLGHRGAAEALSRTDCLFVMNPADLACVRPLLQPEAEIVPLRPFLDTAGFADFREDRERTRSILAEQFGLERDAAWLIAVGMMRRDAKLESYRRLAAAASLLRPDGWRLLVVGDGPARAEVEALFAPLAGRVRFLGRAGEATLHRTLAAADVKVWPAVNEAYGLALLEAQAAGLPVVAGRSPGVADIVSRDETAVLTEPDPEPFAAAVQALIDNRARRTAMGRAALDNVAARHRIEAAARTLDRALSRAARRRAA